MAKDSTKQGKPSLTKKVPKIPDSEEEESVEEVESESDVEDNVDVDIDEDDDLKQDPLPGRKSTRRSKLTDDSENGNDKTDKISNFIQKVFFAHKGIGGVGWNEFETVQLLHPRTKSPALFLMHAKNSDSDKSVQNISHPLDQDRPFMYEILTMTQDTRSWFVEDNVASDGNIYTFTPMDPLFLIAFAMSKSTQARPLMDHLEEVYPRKAAKILTQRISSKQLENIAKKKTVADIEAYVFSECNTLSWLSRKAKKVVELLRKKNITSFEASVSINFTKAADTTPAESTENLRYAGEIVCEYVDEELQAKLFGKLGLPMARPKRKVANDEDSTNKKLKTVDNIQPLEDYGSASKPTPQSAAKAGRGKAKAMELEKAAKGTHLLSKFFQVKPKS